MDIIFQSGDFFNKDNSSFFQNLIGAFIGAATALLVFYLESWREKRKTQNIRNENDKNTLNYFLTLLNNAIRFAEKQSELYKQYFENVKKEPIDFHLLTKVVAGDLNRILNKFDHEKIFNAFFYKFKKTEENIRIFHIIFNRLDYIYELYQQANKSQEVHFTELKEKLNKYKDITEEQILNYCSNLINLIKMNDSNFEKNAFFNVINKAVMEYYDFIKKNGLTFIHMQENFIDPLKKEIVENYRNINEAMYIADNCRRATWLYNETIQKSLMMADEFHEFHNGLNGVTIELKELIAKNNISSS